MKKRICALLLALGLLCALTAVPVLAADDGEALRAVRALGILVGDENGELNLGAPVTRAQFAKMMVAASAQKDSVGTGGGATLYRDVKSGYWGAEYIRLAAEAGWFVGYTDGTFRPDNTITLEEGCTAVLRLLGYDSSSLTGAFPAAQLNKASAIGLREGLSAAQGARLTRAQCVTLFYNLMTCKTSAGQIYAQTLGYALADGALDYSALVESGLKGPFVCDGSTPALPFSAANSTVRRNGAAAELSALRQYDVYYYNVNLRTVWAYSDRASGTLSAVSPSAAAPASATVAGVDYKLSAQAAYALSDAGSFVPGDLVTLLLGRSGEAVAVLSAAESESVFYGVVLSSGKETAATGSAAVVTTVRLACTDGVTRAFSVSSGSFSVGDVLSAAVTADGVTLRKTSSASLDGRFDAAGSTFAGYPLAPDVQILETAGDGAWQTVLPARLAGASLGSSLVRFWTLDEHGAISRLILGDTTGDLWSYGILTSVVNSDLSSLQSSGRYEYVIDGKSGAFSTSGSQYLVEKGGAAFLYNGAALARMKNLRSAAVTELSTLYLRAGAQKYLLADGVQVYLYQNGGYYATTLSDVDLERYTLTAWYDAFDCPAGGRVRVLVAVAR